MTYFDTNLVVWIYEKRLQKIPAAANYEIGKATTRLVSPMVELELEYLQRKKGLRFNPAEVLNDLNLRLNLKVCDLPFPFVVSEALKLSWTDDPFDKLIVAQASATKSKLITSDAHIQAHYKHAVWD